MSNLNIFQNSTKSIPESDEQIVRVDLMKADIGGRHSHLPPAHVSKELPLSHVPNAGSNPGGSK
jgi:hypothetical protein